MSANIYTLRMRLTSTWLGQQKTKDNVRRFRRDREGRIAIDLAHWSWTFQQAAEAMKMLDVDTECIRTESGFEAPSLILYHRKYRYKGKPHEEMFEAIRENNILTMPILVTGFIEEGPSGECNPKHPPTRKELEKLLQFSGKWLGLSPWGCKYGYGRFEVESLNHAEDKEEETV